VTGKIDVSKQEGYEREVDALTFVARVGFTTAPLLADWLWPRSPHRRKLGEALVRRLMKAGKLLARPIPGRATGYVLTRSGAAVLDGSLDVKATPGTGWGRVEKGKAWRPPASYDHDLRAARFLVWASRQSGLDLDVAFDLELRRQNPSSAEVLRPKYPDGTVWPRYQPDRTWWVEVEHSRKNGSDLRLQAEHLVDLGRESRQKWTVEPLHPRRISDVMLVLPPAGLRDRRGYTIDHLGPLTGSIRQALRREREEADRHQEYPEVTEVRLDVYRENGATFEAVGQVVVTEA
jgi:hypothetical protein